MPVALSPTSRSDSSQFHRPLLTIQEVHEHFGGAIGINAIRSAVRDGRIKSLTVGERKRLIPHSELHDWPQREAATHT